MSIEVNVIFTCDCCGSKQTEYSNYEATGVIYQPNRERSFGMMFCYDCQVQLYAVVHAKIQEIRNAS